MQAEPTFCTAIVDRKHVVNTPLDDEWVSETVRYELSNLDEVVRFLKSYHDTSINEIADAVIAGEFDRDELGTLGGFTMRLENKFGHLVEVAIGSKFALLMRLTPEPSKDYRNGPDSDSILGFFLVGGHYVEIEIRDLVHIEDCVKALSQWIETDVFPEDCS